MKSVLFLFGQLIDDDIEWMLQVGNRLQAVDGFPLIQEGQPIESLYIVLEGTLRVAQESREIARIGVGEAVGEMSFVDARLPSATVTSDGPALVFELPRLRLEQRFAEEPAFAARFYKALCVLLSDRLRRMHEFEDQGELDPNVLDGVSQAGMRFDRLHQRVAGQHG